MNEKKKKSSTLLAALGVLGPGVAVFGAYTDTCITAVGGGCQNPGTACTWEQQNPWPGGYNSGAGVCTLIKGLSGSSGSCKCK